MRTTTYKHKTWEVTHDQYKHYHLVANWALSGKRGALNMWNRGHSSVTEAFVLVRLKFVFSIV